MFMKCILGIRQQLFADRLHYCLTVMLFCQNISLHDAHVAFWEPTASCKIRSVHIHSKIPQRFKLQEDLFGFFQ